MLVETKTETKIQELNLDTIWGKLDLETKYRIVMGDDVKTLSKNGQNKIYEVIFESLKTEIDFDNIVPKLFNIFLCIYNSKFDWDLDKTKGKITKRIRRFIKDNFDYKLSDKDISEIGNIIAENTINPSNVEFDFDENFCWSAGDFGDSGSCFWGSNREAKDMIQGADGFAIRTYQNDSGDGRAWIIPHNRGWVLFNGYRNARDKDTEYFSNILFEILTKKFGLTDIVKTRVYLSNNNSGSDTLYINSDRGFLFSTRENVIDKIDLEIYDAYQEENRYYCESCNEVVGNENEGIFDDSYSTEYGYFCYNCYNDRFFNCYNCYETERLNNGYEIDGDVYCSDCASAGFAYCDSCNEYHDLDESMRIDYQTLCPECLNSDYNYCNSCEEYHDNSETTYIDGVDYCPDCLAEKYVTCVECLELVDRDYLDDENDDTCPDCALESEDD